MADWSLAIYGLFLGVLPVCIGFVIGQVCIELQHRRALREREVALREQELLRDRAHHQNVESEAP